MTPFLTNEVGLNVNTTFGSLRAFVPKAAVQNAPNDNLHRHSNTEKITPATAQKYKVAFPNDRSKSIAPFSRTDKFKTLMTGQDRYNYVDPDYAYTDAEREQISRHKDIYKQYIDNLKFYRAERARNKEFTAFNCFPFAGLRPGAGLQPQNLTLSDLHIETDRQNQEVFKVTKSMMLKF